MPTIGVYFSEVEYSKLVSLDDGEKISEHIRSVVIKDMDRHAPKPQAPITVGS